MPQLVTGLENNDSIVTQNITYDEIECHHSPVTVCSTESIGHTIESPTSSFRYNSEPEQIPLSLNNRSRREICENQDKNNKALNEPFTLPDMSSILVQFGINPERLIEVPLDNYHWWEFSGSQEDTEKEYTISQRIKSMVRKTRIKMNDH